MKKQHINEIFIHQKHILHNIEVIKNAQKQASFFPVLKGNAYGHGLTQVLKIIAGENFPYVIVNNFDEYHTVIKKSDFRVLFLSETLPENYSFFDVKRTTFVVYNQKTIQELGKMKKKIKIHLFLNTGMNREGVKRSELNEVLDELKKQKNIILEGVMSHFHSADAGSKKEQVNAQIQEFKELFSQIEAYGFQPIWRHIGASAGIFIMNDAFFNAYRPGGILFGYNPVDYEIPGKTDLLKPALSLHSKIIAIQKVFPGEGVGYGTEYIAQKEVFVAIAPFGYYEGLNRAFKGKLTFYCKEKEVKQVGVISMNMVNFEVDETVKVGDIVEIISENPHKKNSIYSIANASQTLLDEFLVKLHKDIKRRIYKK